jgi:hypothetical protein
MERHLHAPLTLPKHGDLLKDINDMSIAIKGYHKIDWSKEKPGAEEAIKKIHPEPTYDDIIDLLRRAYNAINEQREDPRKY